MPAGTHKTQVQFFYYKCVPKKLLMLEAYQHETIKCFRQQDHY